MNDIQIMTHEQAVSSQAVDRYLLGELNDEQRSAFEAHYFDCTTCFDQVRLSGEFLRHARNVLDPEPEPEPFAPGWLGRMLGDFRRPATAFVTAMLLCVIGVGVFQYNRIMDLKGPRLEARYMLTGASRGGPAGILRVSRNTALSLRVDFKLGPEFSSYQAQIVSESGKVKSSLALPPDQQQDSVTVSVPADSLEPGRYSLVVYGLKADGTKTETGSGEFELQFAN